MLRAGQDGIPAAAPPYRRGDRPRPASACARWSPSRRSDAPAAPRSGHAPYFGEGSFCTSSMTTGRARAHASALGGRCSGGKCPVLASRPRWRRRGAGARGPWISLAVPRRIGRSPPSQVSGAPAPRLPQPVVEAVSDRQSLLDRAIPAMLEPVPEREALPFRQAVLLGEECPGA